MAIQKDLTDDKGVKTRYHKIAEFVCTADTITILIRRYVNQTLRKAEDEGASTYYTQEIETLPYFEPLSYTALYEALTATEKYADGKEV